MGAVTPTYDGNGALTCDGGFKYGYDAESRLTGISSLATYGSCASTPTTVASYTYDAQGRRKSKTVGSSTTLYVTDADNREVLEYDGTSGALKTWYAFGPGPDGVLNAMNVAGGTRATLIPDIQGSIIGQLSSSGSLTKTAYQPFGENPALASNGYFYTGRRLDPETAGSTAQPSGVYYYRARMYSPTWGRFLQADPAGYGGGVNLYAYVGSDPLNATDPLGMGATVICQAFAGCPANFGQVQTLDITSNQIVKGAALTVGFGLLGAVYEVSEIVVIASRWARGVSAGATVVEDAVTTAEGATTVAEGGATAAESAAASSGSQRIVGASLNGKPIQLGNPFVGGGTAEAGIPIQPISPIASAPLDINTFVPSTGSRLVNGLLAGATAAAGLLDAYGLTEPKESTGVKK